MRNPVLVGVLAIILAAPFVFADPVSPVNLQEYSSGSRQLPAQSNGTISAQGGNVTEVNIDALSITKSWQGYYGNVTGSIHLDDAVNQSFYIWGNATPSGEVYASRNDTIQWSTINCTNNTERATEETYLGQLAGDGDSVTNTFNDTTHPSFFVGTTNVTIDSCYSTNVFVSGAEQNTSFHQVLLSDGSNNIVYTTLIEPDATAYNGDTVDFQLIVGENEHPGDEGSTTYYFFVELG